MTPEERELARKAREKVGIATRRPAANLSAVRRVGTMDMDGEPQGTGEDVDVPSDEEVPRKLQAATAAPPHLLQSPPVKPLATTQRAAAYKRQPKGTPNRPNKRR